MPSCLFCYYLLPPLPIIPPIPPSPPNMPENSFEPVCFISVCRPPMPPICGGRDLLICCAFMLQDITLKSPFFGIISPFITFANLLYFSSISFTSQIERSHPCATLYMWVSVSFGFELSSSANQKQTKYEQQQTEPVKKDSYTQQTTNSRQDVCFPQGTVLHPPQSYQSCQVHQCSITKKTSTVEDRETDLHLSWNPSLS